MHAGKDCLHCRLPPIDSGPLLMDGTYKATTSSSSALFDAFDANIPTFNAFAACQLQRTPWQSPADSQRLIISAAQLKHLQAWED